MSRGKNSLKHLDCSQHNLFGEPSVTAAPSTKGRNKELLDRRNKKIIARYYFHNAICNKTISGAIEQLVDEFDLDDRTLSLIIKKEENFICELRKKKPSRDSLKKQYHWPQW